jgi:hypothetical protein
MLFTNKGVSLIKKEMAPECPFTLEHAQVHLNSAVEAEENGDADQRKHDLYSAACILYVLASEE